MPVIIPEKTVEIWTAIAVAQRFPTAHLWSPNNTARSVDQTIRAGKTWAFELKAPYSEAGGRIPIDLGQLWDHVHRPTVPFPILYVLPHSPWRRPSTDPVPARADDWKTFPYWSMVVPARHVAWWFLRRRAARPTGTSYIRLATLHRPASLWWGPPYGVPLGWFLEEVAECSERRTWTAYSEDQGDVPTDAAAVTGDTPGDDVEDEPGLHRIHVHVPLSALPGRRPQRTGVRSPAT